MTIRKEPSVSLITKAGELVGIKARSLNLTHEQLVTDALDTFTKAEQKMTDAISTIEASIAEEKQAIKEAEARISGAEGSKGKLNRVLERIKALTE